MKRALFQITISISDQAEEPIIAIFETLFGKTPSIYVDAKTRKVTASIFLEKATQWDSSMKAKLSKNLKFLRDSGIDIGSGKIAFKKLQPQDWAESWKKHFKPIHVGDALLIKPSWSRLKPRKNQVCVVLDPGLSFGTGQHATTSFCLEQIVRCRRLGQSQSFLDIGTGSGILAISAAKIGYSPIQAFDFDPASARISKQNAAENNVDNLVQPLCRDLKKLPLRSNSKYDLVCANLIYDLLLSERDRIVNRLARDGSLVLAGILRSQFSQVQTAFEKMGLKLTRSKIGKEWQSGCFTFSKLKHRRFALKIFEQTLGLRSQRRS